MPCPRRISRALSRSTNKNRSFYSTITSSSSSQRYDDHVRLDGSLECTANYYARQHVKRWHSNRSCLPIHILLLILLEYFGTGQASRTKHSAKRRDRTLPTQRSPSAWHTVNYPPLRTETAREGLRGRQEGLRTTFSALNGGHPGTRTNLLVRDFSDTNESLRPRFFFFNIWHV